MEGSLPVVPVVCWDVDRRIMEVLLSLMVLSAVVVEATMDKTSTLLLLLLL